MNNTQFDFDYFPVIPFRPEWKVRIIPPFNGASVRFHVLHENGFVSVFADVENKLGVLFDEGDRVPFWEVYPVDGDCQKCKLSDLNELIELIDKSLEQLGA